MKQSIKNLENSAVEITIDLTQEEVKPIKDEVVQKLSAELEIPGFRKGHIPLDVVEAQFGGQVLQEVTDKVMQKYYAEVVKENNLKPVSYARDIKPNLTKDGFVVSFVIDNYPEVKLGTYKGIPATKEKFEMTPEKLDAAIESILNSKAKLVDKGEGEKAETGDTVDLAFEGFIDGVAFEGGKADSHMLELGSHSFIDNFEDQLVGYTAGQEGEVKVKFPEQYGAPDLAGKEATFKVKVNSIKKMQKPELNDETAKELNAESVDDLKAKTQKQIIDSEEARIKNEFITKLLEKLCAECEVAIPQSMIDSEINNRIGQMEQQLGAQGIKLDMYLQMTGMDMDKLKAQLQPMAESQVKSGLILAAIAKEENFTANDDEVSTKLDEIAKAYGMDQAKLKEELTKMGNFDNFLLSVKEEIVIQKALDFIADNAKEIEAE